MDRRLVVGTAMVAMTAIGVLGFTVLTDDNAESSTPCNSFVLNGTVESNICGDVSASWVVGTSPQTTTSVSTTTTTTVPAPSTTKAVTTTTISAQPLDCVAFDTAPTNTFTLNDVLGSPNQINTPTPVFSLRSDGGNPSYTIKVDSTTLPGTYTKYNASTVCIKAPQLTDGDHIISGTEITPNPGPLAPYSFFVDTSPPIAPVINTGTFSTGFVRLSGTCTPTFAVRVSGGGGASCNSSGTWSAATSRPSGTYHIYTKQTDKAGNDSLASNTVTVIVP